MCINCTDERQSITSFPATRDEIEPPIELRHLQMIHHWICAILFFIIHHSFFFFQFLLFFQFYLIFFFFCFFFCLPCDFVPSSCSTSSSGGFSISLSRPFNTSFNYWSYYVWLFKAFQLVQRFLCYLFYCYARHNALHKLVFIIFN